MKKSFKSIFKLFIFSRYSILLALLLLELFIILLPHYILITNTTYYYVSSAINLVFIVIICSSKKHPSFKLAWMTIIALTPGVGALIYLLFADKKAPAALTIPFKESIIKSRGLIIQNKKYQDNLKDKELKPQFDYVSDYALYPYYQNSKSTYFESGALFFEDLKKELKRAKHFIFLEFFIVKDGSMLDELIDILSKKVKEGVKVYFMYDDGGTITCEPENLHGRLKEAGIKYTVFSSFSPIMVLSATSNMRNHRKIVVIDNQVGYTGGLNIADEYIGRDKLFGEWKDTGIKVEGEAVTSFTISFIQFFNVYSKDRLDYEEYVLKAKHFKSDSFILPFSDSPTDKEAVSKNVHYNLITRAQKYIYIHTPYLVIDNTLQNALIMQAKAGVEVIITVPHIPDKKSVFMVTQSNYYQLIKAGVRIFEYTPGFIHSKLIVVDDKIALEGTINMDFRSYYLNYEFGVLIGNDPEIKKMKKDYLDTLMESEEITLEKERETKMTKRIIRAIMNVFAPLL